MCGIRTGKPVGASTDTADRDPTTLPSLLKTIEPEDPGHAKLLIRRN